MTDDSAPVCGSQCPDHDHACRRSPHHQAGICRDAKQKNTQTCTWIPDRRGGGAAGADLPEPTVRVEVTRIEASVLPRDDVNHKFYTLFVDLTGDGWIVGDGHFYYTGSAVWTSDRGDAHVFIGRTAALHFAESQAPLLKCNGITARQAWASTHGGAS